MYFEQFGENNNQTIVFLHGAHFVQTFGRQYPLAEKYHLIIPHITGFGNEADKIFTTEKAIFELYEFIRGLNKKVAVIGFSLGAQLAALLVADYPELFDGAIIVSPWLIKKEPLLSQALEGNLKQFHTMKNKFFCNIIGMLNGFQKKQRKEFVAHMQAEQEQTVRNCVLNGITLDTVSGFKNADFPILAIAGEKEQIEVRQSVKELAKLNLNCKYEIWEKAAHNIPPVFYKKFNECIENFMDRKSV